jgi:hypothetical protein
VTFTSLGYGDVVLANADRVAISSSEKAQLKLNPDGTVDIATESGAGGINLQFCSLLINSVSTPIRPVAWTGLQDTDFAEVSQRVRQPLCNWLVGCTAHQRSDWPLGRMARPTGGRRVMNSRRFTRSNCICCARQGLRESIPHFRRDQAGSRQGLSTSFANRLSADSAIRSYSSAMPNISFFDCSSRINSAITRIPSARLRQ